MHKNFFAKYLMAAMMLLGMSFTVVSCNDLIDAFRDNPAPTPEKSEESKADEEPEAPEVKSEAWTWNTGAPDGIIWGNMGYCGGSGEAVALEANGRWWGVTGENESEEGAGDGFLQQLQHTDDGLAHGDESMDAYFLLFEDGKIERHAGDGKLIKSGTYKFVTITGNEWKVANLETTAGTILFPYEINSGGNMPTIFDVVYKTDNLMTLVYPDNGNFEELGNWEEATFWHFKKK
ncbi:MAG: hypothetical protein IJJ56_05705 [Prevotella sp.]|nr:hypothetical protein [Prevotella sp.]